MLKKTIIVTIVFLCLFPDHSLQCAENCRFVGDDLRLHMPCVLFQGVYYQFDMEYFQNPSDPEGLYWKIDLNTLSVKDAPDDPCLSVKNNLKIYINCAEYAGTRYRFVLKYTPEADPSNLAWKMETNTFSTVPDPPAESGYLSIGDEPWNTSIAYYTPENLSGQLNPGLLVYLHGDGESSLSTLTSRIERDFKQIAEENGLVVIAVQANNLGFQMVDAYGKYMTDDYYNTIDAILLAHQTWGVNPYETYITGYSAGGPGAVMITRGELKPAIRAVNIWCAPYNAYAMIPNNDNSQTPIRIVSNIGDGNYYSWNQMSGANGNGSFGYWQNFLTSKGHPIESVTEQHISGHQFDDQSVRDAVERMLDLP